MDVIASEPATPAWAMGAENVEYHAENVATMTPTQHGHQHRERGHPPTENMDTHTENMDPTVRSRNFGRLDVRTRCVFRRGPRVPTLSSHGANVLAPLPGPAQMKLPPLRSNGPGPAKPHRAPARNGGHALVLCPRPRAREPPKVNLWRRTPGPRPPSAPRMRAGVPRTAQRAIRTHEVRVSIPWRKRSGAVTRPRADEAERSPLAPGICCLVTTMTEQRHLMQWIAGAKLAM